MKEGKRKLYPLYACMHGYIMNLSMHEPYGASVFITKQTVVVVPLETCHCTFYRREKKSLITFLTNQYSTWVIGLFVGVINKYIMCCRTHLRKVVGKV
jgi:hypothetical protein